MNLLELLSTHCNERGERPFLIEDSLTITYNQLSSLVVAAAKQFRRQGFLTGEAIGIHADNSGGMIVSLLGLIMAGCIPVILHPKLSDQRAIHILQQKGIKHRLINFEWPEPDESSSFMQDGDAAAAAVMLCTSGTSGKEKLVVLSHHNLISNVKMIVNYLGLTSADRILLSGSLAHGSNFSGVFLSTLYVGGTLVLYKDAQLPGKVLKAIAENEITYYSSVPTFFRYLIRNQRLKPVQVPALQKIQLSGEAVEPKDLIEIQRLFAPATIYYSYGMTEGSPRLTVLEQDKFYSKAGSSGRVLDEIDLRIVDETFLEQPVGQRGEIIWRGPNLMLEYYNDPELTALKKHEGYFCTGDEGWLDDEGFLYVTGRLDDMINRGGIKISPLVIEQVLLEHPNILEAVVFGKSDEKYGQKICAVLVAENGYTQCSSMEIQAFCRSRLADYEIPNEITWRNEIQYTHSGKRIRRELQIYSSERGSEI
ncbi:class I adenylate-forming enzyme family protein [Paenibacillus wynnii]|uniref:class I adenylate-forming enzyme family protein n=1 Tax=Paenibacillus wynnii TaxID=268407 RepID=UPI00278E23FF|nr:class I adenylate-forming enzyme family protein [Paenibacillus wynnii]MDQ0193754.1 acyl-CoA synthetase (AMP-forming)/AMP-acid ligase II [Paenibacillus wynnii]